MKNARLRAYGPADLDDASEPRWLLGPESVAWTILLTPWVPVIGGLRTLAVEALEPHSMRGVVDHSDYLERPMNRLQRTAAYVAASALGTVEEAERMARLVRSIHERVRGHDPVTGRDYSADDPDAQIWVHTVQWYSYLVAHRVFVGGLTAEDEDRYMAEGVPIAALVGAPAARVPSSVAHARAYFAEVRPRLCLTDGAVEAIRFVTGRRRPTSFEQLYVLPGTRLLGGAAVATIPSDLRRLMGVEGSRAGDAATIAAVRAALPVLKHIPIAGIVSGDVGTGYFKRAVAARRADAGDSATSSRAPSSAASSPSRPALRSVQRPPARSASSAATARASTTGPSRDQTDVPRRTRSRR